MSARSILTLSASLLLAACVGPDGSLRMPAALIPAPTAAEQAAQPKPRPAVCTEMDRITYSTGKPGVTAADVEAALALPPQSNPLGHVRNLLGDTTPTIAQIQDGNAVLDRLCPKTEPK